MNTTLPQNAQDLFNNLIPQGLAVYPDKAREINTTFRFVVSGDGGGDWILDCQANPATVQRTTQDSKAQCTVEMESVDFKTMLSDPSAGMKLYFQHKVRVSGDPMLLLKLTTLCEIARPK